MGDDPKVIRDFVARDQAAVRELVLEGMSERWADDYDPSYNSDLDNIMGNYVERGAEVIVVELEGQIVATGTLIPDGAQRGRIVRTSVDRRYRRRGLGRQVVEELIARARQRNLVEVVVLTDTPWTSAVALYRSCGFDEVGRDCTDTHLAMRL